MIYLIGSLRNPQIPHISNRLREKGYDIYDDWYSPGPRTDEHWKEHQQRKGLSYKEALKGPHARTVFEFDKKYLDMSEGGILVMPAGRSGHLEFGYLVGQGKPGFILMDEEPERWDIMLGFANNVCFSEEELIECLEDTIARSVTSAGHLSRINTPDADSVEVVRSPSQSRTWKNPRWNMKDRRIW